jgi:hypothetical protein
MVFSNVSSHNLLKGMSVHDIFTTRRLYVMMGPYADREIKCPQWQAVLYLLPIDTIAELGTIIYYCQYY